jgi:uncharacterized ferredoxin-like protein
MRLYSGVLRKVSYVVPVGALVGMELGVGVGDAVDVEVEIAVAQWAMWCCGFLARIVGVVDAVARHRRRGSMCDIFF